MQETWVLPQGWEDSLEETDSFRWKGYKRPHKDRDFGTESSEGLRVKSSKNQLKISYDQNYPHSLYCLVGDGRNFPSLNRSNMD